MSVEPESLRQLALERATLVRRLENALDSVLGDLQQRLSDTFENALASDEYDVRSNFNANLCRAVTLTLASKRQPPTGRGDRPTEVQIVVAHEDGEGGVLIRITSRMNSGLLRPGVRPQDVRESARELISRENLEVPGEEAPRGANGLDMWETRKLYSRADDEIPEFIELFEQHVNALPWLLRAYDEANTAAGGVDEPT